MLNLYPVYVAWHYFLWICLAALGVMQAAAQASGLRGLQIGGRLWSERLARGVLALTFLGGATVFVITSPDYISPGLAGSELIAMFAAGAAVALVASLAGGLACRAPARRLPPRSEPQLAGGCSHRLLEPAGEPEGVVLLLADPDLPSGFSAPLERTVLAEGWACLCLDWVADRPAYPDCLAIVPSAINLIAGSGAWAARPVVVGLGLAGDLALRAAGDDERVLAACAIGPALTPAGVLDGLLLLREMSLPVAWRWRRAWDRRGWVRALRSEAALTQLGERARVLADRNDGFVETQLPATGAWVEVVSGAGHADLVGEHAPEFVARQVRELMERVVAGA